MNFAENNKARPGGMRRGLQAVAAVAAAFVICVGGFSLVRRSAVPAVESVVMLDVNPSLSLHVGADEKILSAEALNEDAQEILGTMELKDTSLEVAVNAIIGSMLQKGYLGELQNTVLVSVEDEDAARAEKLQQKVTEAVTAAAQSGALDAAVLSQMVSADDAALAEQARQYGISMGKAALIQEVIAQVPTLTFGDLAPMTINEIVLIASSKNVSSESVSQNGAASDKAYIGQEEALALAYAHAGVSAADVTQTEVEFDSEKGVMIYDVEFETAASKGEYEIDARTGEILKAELKAQNGGATAAGYVGAEAAKAAALSHAGVAAADVVKMEAEQDRDGDTIIYEVEFTTATRKYEYKIDAVTGAVLSFESKEQGTAASQTAAVSSSVAAGGSYIGEEAALSAALSHAGLAEASLTERHVELDREGDRMIYEIELEAGHDEYHYEIDAVSGEILKARQH